MDRSADSHRRGKADIRVEISVSRSVQTRSGRHSGRDIDQPVCADADWQAFGLRCRLDGLHRCRVAELREEISISLSAQIRTTDIMNRHKEDSGRKATMVKTAETAEAGMKKQP